MRSSKIRTKVRLRFVYSCLLKSCFFFKKIGFTQTIFSFSGKTPFAKEILKICFRITNISSDAFLATSADISSCPELLFVLRLANAFSSSNSVRLMVLRQPSDYRFEMLFCLRKWRQPSLH